MKESTTFIVNSSKENRQLMLRILELLDGFQGKLYKGKVRKCITGYLISSWTFFWLVGSEVTGWYFGSQSSTPVSMVLCIHYHAVSFFHLVWFKYLQNNPRIWLRTLSIAFEEELNLLDFVLWLNYYSFVFLEYCLLLLHLLTTLIQFALWNSRED